MNYNIEEDQKTLQREAQAHVEALNSLEGEVVGLREKFHDSLKRSIQGMFMVCNQVMEQPKGFCPKVIIHIENVEPYFESYIQFTCP